jgi:hypothetical protein
VEEINGDFKALCLYFFDVGTISSQEPQKGKSPSSVTHCLSAAPLIPTTLPSGWYQ